MTAQTVFPDEVGVLPQARHSAPTMCSPDGTVYGFGFLARTRGKVAGVLDRDSHR